MNARRAIVACVLLLGLAGCGGKTITPAAPDAHLPPGVTDVYPAARATGVKDDTEIWADFAEPLDPATVGTHTVFLKIDTRRQNVAVSYDTTLRRIRIVPQVRLDLIQTYAVEFSPALATRDGAALGETYFWEFTTNSLRRLEAPYPAHGATGRSPYSPLLWSGTEREAGTLRYRVYIDTDSAAVAGHTTVERPSISPSMFAHQPWATGTTWYWSVTATNETTGETEAGPVWRFETIPPGAAIDSIAVPVVSYGWYREADATFHCNDPSIEVGQVGYQSGLRWEYESLPADLQLAGARIELYTLRQTSSARSPTLWATLDDWRGCPIGYPGPPYIDYSLGGLAGSELREQGTTTYFTLRSNQLTSHLQGILGGADFHGYALTSTYRFSTTFYLENTGLVLFYYR